MYYCVWCLNVNVKNFKFNLHHFDSISIWLRSCLNLTQTSCLNLIQMWLRCILVSSVHHYIKLHFVFFLLRSDSDILFKSDSDVIQMCFNSLCIIMLKCVSSHFILQISCSDLTQMWLRFISVSSVLHHIKMRLHQFLSCFNLCLWFFFFSSCFFSSSCRSSVLKREATVMMSDHQFDLEHRSSMSQIISIHWICFTVQWIKSSI